jgi:hypothetical protein
LIGDVPLKVEAEQEMDELNENVLPILTWRTPDLFAMKLVI